jgi:hypothetical protein
MTNTTTTLTQEQRDSKTYATLAANVMLACIHPNQLPGLAREIMNSAALGLILEKTKPEFLGFTLSLISAVATRKDGTSLSEKQIQSFQRIVSYNVETIVSAFFRETIAADVNIKNATDENEEA